MTTATLSAGPGLDLPLDTAVGAWQAVAEQSQASFLARVAGRPVRGRLPVTGEARVAGALDRCGTTLVASTKGLSTFSRVLDQILKGPGFLETDAYPDITFWSDTLLRVPTGWRAIGWLRVKGIEHELACPIALNHLPRKDGQPPRLSAVSRWALDSTWITGQRVPGLSRRVAMTSSVVLEPAA